MYKINCLRSIGLVLVCYVWIREQDKSRFTVKGVYNANRSKSDKSLQYQIKIKIQQPIIVQSQTQDGILKFKQNHCAGLESLYYGLGVSAKA